MRMRKSVSQSFNCAEIPYFLYFLYSKHSNTVNVTIKGYWNLLHI